MPENKQFIIRLKEGESINNITKWKHIKSCRPVYTFQDDPFKELHQEPYKFDNAEIINIQEKDFYQEKLDYFEKGFYRTYVVETKKYTSKDKFINKLEISQQVESYQEDEKIELFDSPDPLNSQIISYGLEKIAYKEGWAIIGNQGEGVTVAIIDSGVHSNHPDLVDKLIKTNNKFNINLSGDNVDDDLNGHGTHIAGIIGANNNIIGVCGVAPSCKILSIKAFPNSFNSSFDSICANAILEAVNKGAKVINCSWGRKGNNPEVEKQINFAHSKNVNLICAAGNFDSNYVGFSPANHQYAIPVGASDKFDDKYLDSNFGLNLIYAPGRSILSTYVNPLYEELTGTSMSAPYVAGLCALMLSYNPTLTSSQIKSFITNESSLDDIGLLSIRGAGRINIHKCLTSLKNTFPIIA